MILLNLNCAYDNHTVSCNMGNGFLLIVLGASVKLVDQKPSFYIGRLRDFSSGFGDKKGRRFSTFLSFQISKFPGIEIIHCFDDFLTGIHHEGSVSSNWFMQRFSAEHQYYRILKCFNCKRLTIIFK